MDYLELIRYAANAYYNRGLELARERDLSGAAPFLKRALQFNKYHTDARNLLGLIFYEMGETSDALVQWVISINLQPENNRADYYLDEVERKPGRLDLENQTIKKYNQGLIYAQSGSDDLAILQLNNVVEENPKFVKANLLLAILYMAHGENNKAGKILLDVLAIDKNNEKATRYLDYVKEQTGRAQAEEQKLMNAYSHKKMEDDDVILPPSYRENTGWQSIINIGIGLILGAIVVIFLIMPARERSLNYDHNLEMQEYADKLNLANQEADDLRRAAEQAEIDKEEAEADLAELSGNPDSIVTQYQTLIQLLDAYRKGDMTSAMRFYVTLDEDKLSDEPFASILAGLRSDMEDEALGILESLALDAWNSGDLDLALAYYETYMDFDDRNPQVIYNMAMIYEQKGDEETANQLFGQVIMNFSDSDLAEAARTQRGY